MDFWSLILHEYDLLWGYYEKLHDERQRIFENYIRMVGIPITLIGIWVGTKEDFDIFTSDGAILLSILLFVIFIIGLVYLMIYTKETKNANNYLKKIGICQKYIQDNSPDGITILDELYCKGKNTNRFSSIKYLKIIVLSIINAVIIGVMILVIIANKKGGFTKEQLNIPLIILVIALIIELIWSYQYLYKR